ncbi:MULTISPECIES: hypothetical protein [Enterobacter]|uniref:hypothetical protein n=1 Tax=Enterobacter TaxID=547 RepID=UPI000E735C4F|nr:MULTISPECIES: hypothetical protein [Enterobacter]MEB6622544.1 hypothetical protein [Enterobacter roggenkampii]RJK99795.1 hypothetical protein D5066_18265 [Enterobacter chuandaensis]WRT53930.1 hypothetical protein VK758_23630 [Enterobacter bugandensis]
MSASMASYPLLKILHNYRYILIPALVFTTELTVWAALNLKGVGDMGWVSWRVCLLFSVFLVCFSDSAFNKLDGGFLMYGSVVPWGGMLIGTIAYGFIQMNLNFLTLDLFYAGVFCSLAVQLVFTLIQCNCK